MAEVRVGSARGDENGKAYGGQAGDQKGGREVSAQEYYVHAKGWRVFRAKDQTKAAVIGEQMRAACENDLIGYDQWERYDLFKEAEKVGFDLAKVSVPTECDCSELARVCCAAAGIMDLPDTGFRTDNMPKYLLATGEFIELKGSKYTEKSDFLGKGDILVTRTKGHTVVVLNDGKRYEGTIQPKEPELGVDILREGDEGEAVRTMQEYLIRLNFDLGKYGADGDFGPDTRDAVEVFQEASGLLIDGEYGPDTHEALMKALDLTAAGADAVTIKNGSWNLRAGPGTEFEKVGVAKKGDRMKCAETDGWICVLHDDGVAWISEKAVE